MTSPPDFKGEVTPAEGRAGQYRCTDLWFPDGSIIFQAENVLFKVFSGLLVIHSPFFRDMFSLPQPEDQERYEDVPVVQMQDKANDLYYLLRAEHDTRLWDDNDDVDETDWEMVAALLSLGSKYDVPHIRKMALQKLRAIFPTTLSSWKSSYSECSFESLKLDYLVKLTNSARDHHARHLLPAAFLRCSEYEIASVLYHDDTNSEAGLHELTTQNKISLLAGYTILHNLCRICGFRFLQDHLSPPHTDCMTPNTCLEIRRNNCSDMEESLKVRSFFPGEITMGMVQYPILDSMRESGYCQRCRLRDVKTLEDGLSRIWDQLPSVFGLKSWDTLLKSEAETMVIT